MYYVLFKSIENVMHQEDESLARILAGPILRRATKGNVVWFLVCSQPDIIRLQCHWQEKCQVDITYTPEHQGCIRLGEQAWLHTLEVKAEQPQEAHVNHKQQTLPGISDALEDKLPEGGFPEDCWIHYTIGLTASLDEPWQWLPDLLPHTLYEGETSPRFVIKSRIDQLLHGSCRKPHHDSSDGLLIIDDALQQVKKPEDQPAACLMTGDQVYIDDVSGSMLAAIHQVIDLLGLANESLDKATVKDANALRNSPDSYYRRSRLLPDIAENARLRERFFGGVRKPIFTSANADNHLMSLAEVVAIYLLVWSPALWSKVSLDIDELGQLAEIRISEDFRDRYDEQRAIIERFAGGLDRVQRAMANIPVYMIFDDHDITDDWNLTRGWEEAAYGHPFSRRIIGNALIGYFLFQGWANDPSRFPKAMIDEVKACFDSRQVDDEEDGDSEEDTSNELATNRSSRHGRRGRRRRRRRRRGMCGLGFLTKPHNRLIDTLLTFNQWNYTLPTNPKIVVLDTRTQRWRSERNLQHPSGLMDWESLSDLQLELINEDKVIVVSAAPVFGVKLIEVVQRLFSFFGYALTVDAENWMAHPGSANAMLNIFRHARTPKHFVILSGDVHYSFVYDVLLRHTKNSPHIWQITASGLKNEFPSTLLVVFDKLNRWLFASYSPLNWFTRRRAMRIQQRRPSEHQGRYRHQRLANGSGVGRVWIDESGTPVKIEVLKVTGEVVSFTEGYDVDWVH